MVCLSWTWDGVNDNDCSRRIPRSELDVNLDDGLGHARHSVGSSACRGRMDYVCIVEADFQWRTELQPCWGGSRSGITTSRSSAVTSGKLHAHQALGPRANVFVRS